MTTPAIIMMKASSEGDIAPFEMSFENMEQIVQDGKADMLLKKGLQCGIADLSGVSIDAKTGIVRFHFRKDPQPGTRVILGAMLKDRI